MTVEAPAEIAELDAAVAPEAPAPPPIPKPAVEVVAAKCFLACNPFVRKHGYRVAVIVIADDGTYRWHQDNPVVFEGIIRSIHRQLNQLG